MTTIELLYMATVNTVKLEAGSALQGSFPLFKPAQITFVSMRWNLLNSGGKPGIAIGS